MIEHWKPIVAVGPDEMWNWFLAVVFVIIPAGCHPLPAGDLSAVNPVSTGRRRGSVYLVRGWQDLWSGGIDQLAAELRCEGVRSEVYRASQWRPLAETIAARYGASTPLEPLVLVGFSYGSDDALQIARTLGSRQVAVDLVVTIDPVTPPPVPANVRACYNLFQTNGIWDAFPWLRGVPLRSAAAGRLTNVDIRRQRRDLLEPDTGHANIAANPMIHREIVRQVLSVCTPR